MKWTNGSLSRAATVAAALAAIVALALLWASSSAAPSVDKTVVFYEDDESTSASWTLALDGEGERVMYIHYPIPEDAVYGGTDRGVRYTASGVWTDAYEVRMGIHPSAGDRVGQPALLVLPAFEFLNLEEVPGYPRCPDFPIGSETWNDRNLWVEVPAPEQPTATPSSTSTPVPPATAAPPGGYPYPPPATATPAGGYPPPANLYLPFVER